MGFAMTAVPPEFSVLWAGPKQSKEDGQAAAVICQQHGDKGFYLCHAPGALSFQMAVIQSTGFELHNSSCSFLPVSRH